jgi:hypothetical protein
MTDFNIDRLSLHLSGMGEAEGQRLARLVADGLANASMVEVGGEIGAMRSQVSASTGSDLQELSDRIVADLLRQLGAAV